MLKNVIFDITNVILKFNRDDLLSHFYNGKDYDLLKEKLFCDWELLDEGLISVEDYNKNVLASLPEHLRPYALSVLDNWEYYMYFNHEIIDLIRELKCKGYNLYLLSNITQHFIDHDYLFPIFREFDGIVYSAPIKLLKPNPEIYKYLLDKFSLKGEECLFIDDIKENLVGATRFKIKTFHYNFNTQELRDYILTL